jgi:hypothetical protein
MMASASDRPCPGRAQVCLELEPLEERCLLSGTSFTADPVIPLISQSTKVHLQAIYQQGLQMGNRPDVFAKVGDSISWISQYLDDLGSSLYNPSDPGVTGAYTGLASTIDYFRAVPLPGGTKAITIPTQAAPLLPQPGPTNSFNRNSLAAFGGWTTGNLLNPNQGFPEASEFLTIRPAFALIMIGTNDVVTNILDGDTPAAFQARLTQVADTALSLGVIPVLSTIPDMTGLGPLAEVTALEYNQIMADVAASLDVPLWNYWLALQPLPNEGISADGVHPDSSPLGSGNFTPGSLLFGMNVRNLTAVEVLNKLLDVVVENGMPDILNLLLTGPTVQYVTSLYQTLLGHVPDPAGLQTYGELVQNGLPLETVVPVIWQAADHRGREVNQFYSAYLHRTPGAAEQAGWVNAFLAGATEEQVQAAILTSPEYQAGHASDDAFVAGLYQDVLGRSADITGEAGWVQALENGLSRTQLALDFLQGAEFEQNVIAGYYQTFLNRQAGPAELQSWLNTLRQTGQSFEAVGEEILESQEYFGMVQPTTSYLTGLYQTLLGRPLDAGALTDWEPLIQYGAPFPDISTGIWQSAEHRSREITQYYATYLHRTPSATELAGWLNDFEAGATEDQVQAAILTSPEYQAGHASDDAFVAGLYLDVLGRPADTASQASWVQNLHNGMSREQLALTFLQSPEFQSNVIAGYYQAFLNRTAATAEIQFWASFIQANGLSVEAAGEQILESYEFYAAPH